MDAQAEPASGNLNLLVDPLIRVVTRSGETRASLPQLLALLVADEVESLPALRPHQKQALHCFLAQAGAMAMLRASEAVPPREAEAWAKLLRGLTPDLPDDEPWRLVVEDLAKPAFMQPPVPEREWGVLKEREETPDALDMLVTSKNHDLKAARLTEAVAEHWLLALLTLQTCEGFLGRGNYGISRMNGGFATRPFVGAAPRSGGWGAHVRRDMTELVARRTEFCDANPMYAPSSGIGLVWLEPWDGTASLGPRQLDPYYIEVCRRIRLRREAGRVVAFRGASKSQRVELPDNLTGLTGDAWTPIDRTSASPKPLTVDGRGFAYRRVVDLLNEQKFVRAPLQHLDSEEVKDGAVIVLVATVRGQGETQGFHERRIPVPPRAVPVLMRKGPTDRLGVIAGQRVADAADVQRKALRPALFALFQGAPEKTDFKDPKADTKAKDFLAAFDRSVDADFFEHLFAELEEEAETPAARARRRAWIGILADRARDILAAAEAGSPLSHVRRYRARAAAQGVLEGALRNHLFSRYAEVEA